MKAKVTLREINPDYNKKQAEVYNFGRESADNQKHNWSRTTITVNATEYAITNKTTFTLCGVLLKNVTLVEFKNESEVVMFFVISDKLIKNIHKAMNSKYNTLHLYIYFDDKIEFQQIENPIFIAKDELPQELMKYLVIQ